MDNFIEADIDDEEMIMNEYNEMENEYMDIMDGGGFDEPCQENEVVNSKPLLQAQINDILHKPLSR